MNKKTIGERIFEFFNNIFFFLVIIIMLYPVLYVLFASFSDADKLFEHNGLLLKPIDFSLDGYKLMLDNPNIITGYKNTIIVVVFGTLINVVLTSLGAYTLSRRNFYIKNAVTFMITFTMFFSGGTIPLFLTVKGLGLLDTRLSLMLPGAINVWNLIIMRTYFAGIPISLEEAAKIDGASDWTVLWKIILPISKPIIAVMILYYGVAHWNSWFNAILYINDRKLYPLQVFLREMLITFTDTATLQNQDLAELGNVEAVGKVAQHCSIIVATVPMLILYPFLQKYFEKGVMIGAIKG